MSNHNMPILKGAILLHTGKFCRQQVSNYAASQGRLLARAVEPVLSLQREPDDVQSIVALSSPHSLLFFMPGSLHLQSAVPNQAVAA